MNTKKHRLIAREIGIGFAAVSAVSVVMSLILLSVVRDVSQLVSGMQHDERAIAQGQHLTTAVRDTELQIGRCLVDPTDANFARYTALRDHERAQIQRVAAAVPQDEVWRIEALGDNSQRMHDVFVNDGMVAARAGRVPDVRRAHGEISELSIQAAGHADALASAIEGRMSQAHVRATDATQLGLFIGVLGIALIVVLSVGFTYRLRARLLQPLHVLTEAAGQLARGHFDTKVGYIGGGELGELAAAFEHMTDELARREIQLVRTERMAAIGQLAAGIAHELNNPIGIIRGYLKTMEPEDDADTLREEIAILDEEAGHCQRIAEDLLTYARVRGLEYTEVDADELLRDTARRFEASLSKDKRTVELDVVPCSIEVDRARIRQVLLNLLNNADSVTPQARSIVVRGFPRGDDYCIEVVDSGPGVAEADRTRIFEPFYSARRGGSGLGLAVVLGLVEAHHGRIEVDEAPTGGAVFRVILPQVNHA